LAPRSGFGPDLRAEGWERPPDVTSEALCRGSANAKPQALCPRDVHCQKAADFNHPLSLHQGACPWELGAEALQREVEALRCGLDVTAWYGDGALRCTELLKLPLDALPQADVPLPFNTPRAHALYKGLFGKVEDAIRGKHLLVVPSGALTTLPFQVLVAEQPKGSELASTRWLIRNHAITVLPSVGSLKALRRLTKPSQAPRPMLGSANPLLNGNQSHPEDGDWYKQMARRARETTGCAATPGQRTVAFRGINRRASPIPQPAGVADLAHLRAQPPLPETADEVCEVARSLGADVRIMRIGARATETEVKRLSETGELANYRILHFATHGLLAGQLSGTREPGLILTPPPSNATRQDDGYLSASEIATLKLDADWVILSACNTAGGAGEDKAAEALSGLARVFFYAGARALLVSHWEVDSDAAVQLVTGAAEALAKDQRLGRAEALRQAVLTVMADSTRPPDWVPFSHPAVWAPFVVVGEGRAGR
jgi:CHAT domain-containing protein